MSTFQELCGDAGWAAIVKHQDIFDYRALGFLDHMAEEYDREMSPGQEHFASDCIRRALFQEKLECGEYHLPLTLGPRREAATPQPTNDNLDDLLKEKLRSGQ